MSVTLSSPGGPLAAAATSALSPGSASAPLSGASAPGLSFQETVQGALSAVNSLVLDAQGQSEKLANGTATSLHDVTIALEKSNIALQLTTTVRNKALEAYQEIMRMSV